MIDVVVNKFLWSFSLVSFLVEFLVRKVICMALGCTSSSSSSSWINFQFSMDRNSFGFGKTISQGLLVLLESPQEDSHEEKLCLRHEEVKEIVVDGISLKSHEERYPHHQNPMIHKVKVASKIRKRPARLVVPESFSGLEQLGEVVDHEPSQKDFQMEGKDFCMASRRGRKNVMEDGYGVLTDIMGDSKQAFFGVFDGHGGRAAVDFVADNLGKNIVSALVEIEEAQDESREAIKKGYLVTDRGFLSQDVSSGACAATALVKNGNLYVANVGDCRVVLSREGVATALTSDHRLEREDERSRIEDMGGYVNCQNGVWRVQGSLAVSRAIGDLHLKQWVISEPEIKMLELTSDCEFLVIASDGLWDKVSNQEAVDMVVRDENSIESCKKLVDVSSSRGNRDDITVMVVDLQNFKRHKG